MKTIIAPLTGSQVIADPQEAYLAALTNAARKENAAFHRNSRVPIGDKGSEEHRKAMAEEQAKKQAAIEREQHAQIRRIKALLAHDAMTAPEIGRLVGIPEVRMRALIRKLEREGILRNVAKALPAMWQVVK